MRMRRALAWGAICLALASWPRLASDAQAQTPPAPHGDDLVWLEAPTLAPLQVILPPGFEPESAHTLVLALHGYGDTAANFRPVADRLAAGGFIVALPQAPYAIRTQHGLGYDWTLAHRQQRHLGPRAMGLVGRELLPGAVAAVRERHAIDRVFILGFSQGALVALLTGLNNPDIFEGIVSFGLPEFEPSWAAEKTLEAARRMRVLFSHGKQDERAPLQVSESARDALTAAGLEVDFRPFRGGHSIPDEQLASAVRWLRRGAGKSPDAP